jgi:hypothetical protein
MAHDDGPVCERVTARGRPVHGHAGELGQAEHGAGRPVHGHAGELGQAERGARSG